MHPRFILPFMLAMPLCGCSPAAEADTSLGTDPTDIRSPYVATSVGRIDSESEARQLVAAVDGVIAQLLVHRGQRVSRGQVLLRVDCNPRQAQAVAQVEEALHQTAVSRTILDGARKQEVDAARNAVLSAAAARAEAADRFEQAEALAERGFLSRRELSARRNTLSMAEADLASAQAQASLVESGPRASDRLAAQAAARAAQGEARAAHALAQQCDLVSPIDGEVLQIFRREGEFSGASQGTPLIAIADLSRLVVRVEISERDAALVQEGLRADIWIEGSRTRWNGRVTTLARVMGRRSARSLDPTDRFDRDVREAFVAIEGPNPPALVGLRVMVGVKPR